MNPSFYVSTSTKPLFRILTCAAISLWLACASTAHAQEKNPKYELGIHYTALNVNERSDTDSGLGMRFTYNFNDYLGLEAEQSYFGNFREGSEGNERLGLFGVRAGKRNKRYGLFAKVRPGYATFYSLGTMLGPQLFEQDRTRFTVDVGGVFEYYLHRHAAIRVDAGDTMVHFKTGDHFFQGIDTKLPVQRKLSHNLQINVGFAFRF
jgi:opacity protein-like surface antigen